MRSRAPCSGGAVFLLAEINTEPPDGLRLLTDFEYVDIQGGTLRFWQIEVSADTDLASIGYGTLASATLLLQWQDYGRKLVGNAGEVDVFVAGLPGLIVRQLEQFRLGALALYWDDGKKPRRVELPSSGTEGVIRLPVEIPCRGRVWVESLWRSRKRENASEDSVEFCVFPDCFVKWPRAFSDSEEDQPCVEIAGDATVSGDFEACDRIDAVRKWRIPKGDRFVEGVLRCEDVAARVAGASFGQQ